MLRTISVASSFFAACFAVLTSLAFLALAGAAAFADEPLDNNGCYWDLCYNYEGSGTPCAGGIDCTQDCFLSVCQTDCYCDIYEC